MTIQSYFFAAWDQKIAALQAAGKTVIRLDIGSPDQPPPPHVIAALQDAASRADTHGYQAHNATPALRRAWAACYQREFGVLLDPESEVLPLLGSKEGIFHLGLARLRPGDAAIVPDPGYVTYSRGAQAAGADVFRLPLRPTNGYLPDFDVIPADTLRRARLLWLNYPHNPTGATAPLDIFVRAVDFARRHDLLLCHDAAYTRVTFDGYRAPSVLKAPGAKEVAVEFNSLSKSHNMAGWRVGVLVGNRDVVTALHRYKTNADSGHFLPVLEAAAAALEATPAAWIEARNRAYAARREVVLHTLESLGLSALHPKGGMYVWSPIPQGWDSAEKFALDLLEQAHISLTPGTVFGAQGEGHVRIALTAPIAQMQTAMKKIKEFANRKSRQ